MPHFLTINYDTNPSRIGPSKDYAQIEVPQANVTTAVVNVPVFSDSASYISDDNNSLMLVFGSLPDLTTYQTWPCTRKFINFGTNSVYDYDVYTLDTKFAFVKLYLPHGTALDMSKMIKWSADNTKVEYGGDTYLKQNSVIQCEKLIQS